MSKFADDIKLCHRAINPDDIMKRQEDKLVEWANKWQMSINVDKCFVMHIGHNNMQSNHNLSNQQLLKTDQQPDLGMIIKKTPKVVKTNREKLLNGQQSSGVHCPQFQVQKQRTDPPIIQILVRPHLEHAVQLFWSQHLRRDIDKMESYREEQQ